MEQAGARVGRVADPGPAVTPRRRFAGLLQGFQGHDAAIQALQFALGLLLGLGRLLQLFAEGIEPFSGLLLFLFALRSFSGFFFFSFFLLGLFLV